MMLRSRCMMFAFQPRDRDAPALLAHHECAQSDYRSSQLPSSTRPPSAPRDNHDLEVTKAYGIMMSPSKQRSVLGEIGNISINNSPTKRKLCQHIVSKEDEEARKRLRFGQGMHDEQENHLRARQFSTTSTEHEHPSSKGDHAGTVSTQDTLPDHPESQDTITDTDIPSSSSDRPQDVFTVSRAAPEHLVSLSAQSSETIAANIKRRLQLAMYKLKSHKEDINYRKLVPRQLISGRVEHVAQPKTRPIPQSSPSGLASHLNTPKPLNSIVSNERTLPRVLQRSSSGDAFITETPIRRNYKMGLSSPPDSHKGLPSYGSVKLPSILDSPDPGQSRDTFNLPSISALGTISQTK